MSTAAAQTKEKAAAKSNAEAQAALEAGKAALEKSQAE